MKDYKYTLEQAGAQGLPFTMTPLAFEATGAMSTSTQKWFKQMVKENKELLKAKAAATKDPATTSRMQLGLPHTWTANKFSTYWKQRLSFFIARDRAMKATIYIGKSQPKADRGWENGG